MDPLYKSEVTTPGWWVLIGGGGISEAEDEAIVRELLRYLAGTGMVLGSLA